MIDTIKSYLDKSTYYIINTNDMIYIKNYSKLITIDQNKIIFLVKNTKYVITGNNFILKKHIDKEMIINGNLESIITYDNN
jgi:phage antirepressor YoqD-like protein